MRHIPTTRDKAFLPRGLISISQKLNSNLYEKPDEEIEPAIDSEKGLAHRDVKSDWSFLSPSLRLSYLVRKEADCHGKDWKVTEGRKTSTAKKAKRGSSRSTNCLGRNSIIELRIRFLKSIDWLHNSQLSILASIPLKDAQRRTRERRKRRFYPTKANIQTRFFFYVISWLIFSSRLMRTMKAECEIGLSKSAHFHVLGTCGWRMRVLSSPPGRYFYEWEPIPDWWLDFQKQASAASTCT